MNSRTSRTITFLATVATVATLSAACGSDDDCKTVSTGNFGAVMAGATVRPQPPKANTPKVNTPQTRATSTRTQTTVKPPAWATPTKTTTLHTTAPTTMSTSPVAIKPGNKARKLKGESKYYPTPVAPQSSVNVLLAQDAVRMQIETSGRFTKKSVHKSPVTLRTYVYHSDDDYKNVPQDLYDPFDYRNWTQPYSPFNLSTLVIDGHPVIYGPNVLNGDYREDETPEQESTPSYTEPLPPAGPSPSDTARC